MILSAVIVIQSSSSCINLTRTELEYSILSVVYHILSFVTAECFSFSPFILQVLLLFCLFVVVWKKAKAEHLKCVSYVLSNKSFKHEMSKKTFN